jgi:hypothetical protein
MSETDWKRLRKKPQTLRKSKESACTRTGQPLKTIGEFEATVAIAGTTVKTIIVVDKGSPSQVPLIGKDVLRQINGTIELPSGKLVTKPTKPAVESAKTTQRKPTKAIGTEKPEEVERPKEAATETCIDKTMVDEFVRELKSTHKHVLVDDLTKAGKAKITPIEVAVNSDEDVVSKTFRINDPKQRELYEGCVQGLLKKNAISKIDRALQYCANMLLVKKSDGSMRPVVNFAKINTIIKEYAISSYTLEDMRACKSLGDAKFFSKFDLAEAFHQLPLDEGSRKYTQFACDGKYYQYNVLPMGMKISSAIMQTTMNKILEDQVGKSVFISTDDILVFSKTWDEHKEHVRRLFDRLAEHNLVLKRSKAVWVPKKLRFLGHIISEHGMQPDDDKLRILDNIVMPTTREKLRSLMGFFNFFNVFIAHTTA